jgi:hypothetical protein
MTGDSLSVFSRVRLYTAIYPEGDVADSTEIFSLDPVGQRNVFPVLSLKELSLKQLPSVKPLRYQSPIALVLGAKLKISPATIAQEICQGSIGKGDLYLSCNDAGWITLTWEMQALWEVLAQVCEGFVGLVGVELPFFGWQVADRVRSLREQLRSLHPEFDVSGFVALDAIERLPDPLWGLLEAMVVFFDRLSDFPARSSNPALATLLSELRSLCDAFEQMHRQIPLFSVATSVSDRYAVWLVLGWFQQIFADRKITDK